MQKWRKIYPLAAVASASVYFIAVIIGGFLAKDGYTHVANAVSELELYIPAVGYAYIEVLFNLSHVLAIAFGASWLCYGRRCGSRYLTAGFALQATNSLISLMYTFFPQDPRGAALTAAGTIHLALAGVNALFSIAAPLLVGIGLRKDAAAKRLSRASLVMALIIVVFGGLTPVTMTTPYFGVAERLVIGTWYTWLMFAGFWYYRHQDQSMARVNQAA
jgi:hypothetical protein